MRQPLLGLAFLLLLPGVMAGCSDSAADAPDSSDPDTADVDVDDARDEITDVPGDTSGDTGPSPDDIAEVEEVGEVEEVEVVAPALLRIDVEPPAVCLEALERTTTLSLTGTYAVGRPTDFMQAPIASGASFTTSAPEVAHVSSRGVVTAQGQGQATIMVSVGDVLQLVPVTVRAREPFEHTCPTPIIEVLNAADASPEVDLRLDGGGSYSPGGCIDSWTWRAVSWPEGTPAPTWSLGSTSVAPVVDLHAMGDHVFALDVQDHAGDRSGTEACPSAEVTVRAQPVGIRVVLSWTKPAEAQVSADLDLHFAHPKATAPDIDDDGHPDLWFDDEWDVFWFNRNPQWDASFERDAANPQLFADVEGGGGPEVVRLLEPEAGLTYTIGVHGWGDGDQGPVDATVEVWLDAVRVYEATLAELTWLDLWCVGRITWPATTVERCAPDGEPEDVTPLYINPFFRPPSL